MTRAVFISATGTDVGKTYVSGLIVKKLRENGVNAGYYKAALSGAEVVDGRLIPGDAKFVCDIAGIEEEPQNLVSYIYEKALSPHLATKLEGNPLEEEKVLADFKSVCERYDYVVVEGSGGIICPIRYDDKIIMLEDIIKLLDLNTLVVAPSKLGAINSTVLTIEYLNSKNIKTEGIIVNNYEEENILDRDNIDLIEKLTKNEVVFKVKDNQLDLDVDIEKLKSLFKEV